MIFTSNGSEGELLNSSFRPQLVAVFHDLSREFASTDTGEFSNLGAMT